MAVISIPAVLSVLRIPPAAPSASAGSGAPLASETLIGEAEQCPVPRAS